MRDHEVIGVNVFLRKLTRFLRKKGLTGAPYASCVCSHDVNIQRDETLY